MTNTTKKLYASTTDRKFAGVCGGVAEYFAIDSTMVRLAWIILVVLTGFFPGVLAYIIAAIVVPEKPTAAGPGDSPLS